MRFNRDLIYVAIISWHKWMFSTSYAYKTVIFVYQMDHFRATVTRKAPTLHSRGPMAQSQI